MYGLYRYGHIVKAQIGMTPYRYGHTVMAYMVMAYIVMACIDTAYIVMAEFLSQQEPGLTRVAGAGIWPT